MHESGAKPHANYRRCYIFQEKDIETRKSSCVNARGIPPTAVANTPAVVLFWGDTYPWMGDTPFLCGGTPVLGGGYPSPGRGGTPVPHLEGIPVLARGYPSPWTGGYLVTWSNTPRPWTWGYLPWSIMGWYLPWGTPPPSWPWAQGYLLDGMVPTLGYPQKGHPDLVGGYPPCHGVWGPPGCGQTDTCENSTFPSYYVSGR